MIFGISRTCTCFLIPIMAYFRENFLDPLKRFIKNLKWPSSKQSFSIKIFWDIIFSDLYTVAAKCYKFKFKNQSTLLVSKCFLLCYKQPLYCNLKANRDVTVFLVDKIYFMLCVNVAGTDLFLEHKKGSVGKWQVYLLIDIVWWPWKRPVVFRYW